MPSLLERNPNAAAPFRLSRAPAVTCDQDHDYADEQAAFDFGLMDKYVELTGNSGSGCDQKLVMGHYDGNTVTALWSYAQHFAMSDNSYGTTFGESGRLPGALRLRAAPAAIGRLGMGEGEQTGGSGASATSRSTRWPVRSTTCSTSAAGTARRASSSIRRPAGHTGRPERSRRSSSRQRGSARSEREGQARRAHRAQGVALGTRQG